MKISRKQLRYIIKEAPRYGEEYASDTDENLYTNLDNDQLSALDELEYALDTCLEMNISAENILDTVNSKLLLAERRMQNIIRQRISEARGGKFAVDILEPAAAASEIGMSHGEYIQLHVDAANRAKVKIVENTPDIFTVQGSSRALLKYGRLVAQAEGGPSFNAQEFKEYAMYEV